MSSTFGVEETFAQKFWPSLEHDIIRATVNTHTHTELNEQENRDKNGTHVTIPICAYLKVFARCQCFSIGIVFINLMLSKLERGRSLEWRTARPNCVRKHKRMKEGTGDEWNCGTKNDGKEERKAGEEHCWHKETKDNIKIHYSSQFISTIHNFRAGNWCQDHFKYERRQGNDCKFALHHHQMCTRATRPKKKNVNTAKHSCWNKM